MGGGLTAPPIYGKKDNYPPSTQNRQKIRDKKKRRETFSIVHLVPWDEMEKILPAPPAIMKPPALLT